MRVFIASLITETNSFAPFPTGQSAYGERGIRRDASMDRDASGSPLAIWRTRSEAAGWTVAESISAFAQPAGNTVRSVYEGLRDTILSDLRDAGPIDIVLLFLHGAMIADGYDDCEGDLVTRVRALLPGSVIGVEIDPHCHLTDAMLRHADVIVIFKEYPHIDGAERAEEVFDICRRTASGQVSPVAAMADTRMVGFYPTFHSPMREIVADLRAAEQRPGVLSASIAHGFPWGDVADVGTRALVYADGDTDLATREALAIAGRLYAERDALLLHLPGIPEALDRAAASEGRVVLGDYSDNAGGGAPGDSTFFLRAMVARGLRDAAIGAFHDPAVARICADAGVGARFPVRLGGKAGPASGDPVDLEVEVMAVAPEHRQSAFGNSAPMGLSVWLRHGGIDILVNSIRQQVYGTDAFSGCGIDLQAKRLIVVKSSTHFEAEFQPLADLLLKVVSPGALRMDFESFRYSKRDGHYHPRVADPWAGQGRPAASVHSRSRPT